MRSLIPGCREELAQRLGIGMSYHFGRIEMVANTDTFIDAPYHLPAEAADVAELPLGHLVECWSW